MSTAILAAQVEPASAAAESPEGWAEKCSSDRLGLDKVKVELAPLLDGDKGTETESLKSVPDARGKFTPVIFVHGWTGSSTHNDARTGAFSKKINLSTNPDFVPTVPRSLIGAIQDLPGAAVFTYDYEPYSGRWVDDSHVGPGLGKAIDCLYRQSGQKVIIVGHSMGGLAARFAASSSNTADGNRAAEISTVVTYGTPELGSVAALLSNAALEGGASIPGPLAVLRAILAECGRQSSADIQTGTLCDGLPASARGYDSQAGKALRPGSAQLRALKPFPKGITVTALAGSTTMHTPKLGWFNLPWSTDQTDVGDLVVSTDSALSGSTSSKRARCDYQLSAVRGATDTVGLQIGLITGSDVARAPLGAFSGPCFHGELMRTMELASETIGAVADDIESRQSAVPTLGIPFKFGFEMFVGAGAVKPTRFTAGGGADMIENVTWHNWGSKIATGRGEHLYTYFDDSGIDVGFTLLPVEITASDLGDCGGVWAYRTLSWHHTDPDLSRLSDLQTGGDTDVCPTD